MEQDFEIPTTSNRLYVRDDTLYQVMVTMRHSRATDKVAKDKTVQRELKQIIALMLDEDTNSEPVYGRKIRVTLKRFEDGQGDLSKLFSFARGKRKLKPHPTVFSFNIELL
jgi:hypothetical protein